MKQRHMYSLMDGGFTTIQVKFDGPTRAKPSDKPRPWDVPEVDTYTYKVRLDANVAEGDDVLVLVNGAYKVVRVVKVDASPVIDLDADFQYQWIVQRVNREAYDAEVKREAAFNEAMLEVERVKQREQFVQSFRDALPEGSAARALFDQTTGAYQLSGISPVTPPSPPYTPTEPPVQPWAGHADPVQEQ